VEKGLVAQDSIEFGSGTPGPGRSDRFLYTTGRRARDVHMVTASLKAGTHPSLKDCARARTGGGIHQGRVDPDTDVRADGVSIRNQRWGSEKEERRSGGGKCRSGVGRGRGTPIGDAGTRVANAWQRKRENGRPGSRRSRPPVTLPYPAEKARRASIKDVSDRFGIKSDGSKQEKLCPHTGEARNRPRLTEEKIGEAQKEVLFCDRQGAR